MDNNIKDFLLSFILSNENVDRELKRYNSDGQKIIIEIIKRTIMVSELDLSFRKDNENGCSAPDLVYTLDVLSSITPTSIKRAVIDILANRDK